VSYTAAGTAPNNLPAQYRAKLLRKYMPLIPAVRVSVANEVRNAKDRHAGMSSDTRHKEHEAPLPWPAKISHCGAHYTKGSMKFSSTQSSSCSAHGKRRYRDKVMSQQFQQVQRGQARPNLVLHAQTDP